MRLQQIMSLVRRCIQDYEMIREGDRIAVGVSGGKDSLLTLAALAHLRRFFPASYALEAVTLDLGFGEADYAPLAEYCVRLDVPFTLVPTNIGEIVFDIRKEPNPCSLCANLRRGILYSKAKELGCGKVALGHHLEDASETFLMSLLYEGRISCFRPVTWLDRQDVTVIRPLLYVRERDAVAAAAELPVVSNPCPANGHTKRQEAKELLRSLGGESRDTARTVFQAMQRYPLSGWETIGRDSEGGGR